MKTEIKTRKTIPLCGGAEAHVELLTGKNIIKIPDITDDEMGVTISHIIPQSDYISTQFFGDGLKLNLHENFVKSGDTDYIYTDSLGDTYLFHEYYVYFANDGTKRRVEKENVTVLDDGNLVYNDGTTVFPVEREVVTYDGLKASTKLEGVKNIEDYEQRTDELRQAEERYESYIDTYRDCVICNENGEVETSIPELNANEIKKFVDAVNAMEESDLILTKSEVTNLKSLKKNRAILQDQTSEGYLLKLSKTNTRFIDKLVKDINEIGDSYANNQEQNKNDDLDFLYLWETICDYYVLDIKNNNFSIIDVANSEAGSFELSDGLTQDESMHKKFLEKEDGVYRYFALSKNERVSYVSCLDQIANIDSQIALLREMSKQHKEKILEYFDELTKCEESIEKLKLQTPVNFVMSDSGTKGFNENGDLVVIYNKRGNYVAVEYENYYNGTNSLRRICKLYDDKEREITFAYDHKDRISEITNSKGQTVKFTYGMDLLTVEYPNGESVKIFFNATQNVSNKIEENEGETEETEENEGETEETEEPIAGNIRIEDSRKNCYYLKLDENQWLIEVVRQSLVSNIKHGEVETISTGTDYVELSKIAIDYDTQYSNCVIAKVTDSEEEITDIYAVDTTTERLTLLVQEKRGVVTKAEKYVFWDESTKNYKTIKAKSEILYKRPFDTFTFVDGDYTHKILNVFNRAISEESVVYEGDVTKTKLSEYTYTPKDQISGVKTTVKIEKAGVKQEEKVHHEIYEYNSVGALMCKKSYAEGEESINGVDIEEHIYDENGCEIKTVKYNSLDPSSKFYTEKEYDETGKEIGQLDVTGKHKTVFVYDKDGVSSKIYPSGSKISYGESEIGGNSAVTISTEDGEENSIQVLCTNGLPTKVKSGNDEYEFEYDNKGRKTLVKRNGVSIVWCAYTDGADEDRVSITEKGATTVSIDNKASKSKIFVKSSDVAVISQRDERDRLSYVTEDLDGAISQTTYTYDDLDRVTACERQCDNLTSREEYVYDIYGNISSKTVTNVNGTVTYNYEYSTDSKRKLQQVVMVEDVMAVIPKTDNLGRNTGKKIGNVIDDTITYVKHGSHATNMPASITYADGSKISYKYDSMGNIVKVFENGILSTEYEYDSVGRLVRENNKKQGTRVYKYDSKGNILTNTGYSYSRKDLEELETGTGSEMNYAYDYRGMLSSIDSSECVYMDDGRCSKYKGENVTWDGKEMVGYGTHTFTYDAKGRRKTKDNITFTYDVKGRLIKQSNGVSFIYDHESLIGFKYDGNTYYYRKDPFGSIVAILDSEGQVVLKYIYNAWGEYMLEGTNYQLAMINPFTYRGYYHDFDTGLYFLKTRYYDPMTGRFISMDDVEYIDPETIGGVNLFAYCNNNPVMQVDETGNMPKWLGWLISGVEVVAGIALIATGVGAKYGATLIGSGVGSLINGYITEANGGTFGAGWTGGQAGLLTLIPGVGDFFAPFVGSIVTDGIDSNWEKFDWKKAMWSSFLSLGISSFSSTAASALEKSKIQDKFAYFANMYDSILAGVANSIVNVFWRGNNNGK